MFGFNLNVRMNGYRGTIFTTSDKTLAEVFDENNLNYGGVRITLAGKNLDPDDLNRPMGDIIPEYMPGVTNPETVFINAVKAQDCAA